MNPAPQHRQFAPGPRALHQQGGFRSLQPYYSRPSLPSNAPRVPPSSTPRPVAPTHVYQPGQQMMMIPSQQIPFSNQQGPAYFIPGQYRSTYVATPQQYPVPPGTPGFYPGTSPAEYGTYAGAYYPAQQQYTSSVPAAPVIMNPPPQQQQPPPQQQIHPKREHPNQGGKDITEEIMSGGTRSGTTPTPPQDLPTPPSVTTTLHTTTPQPSTSPIADMDAPAPAAAPAPSAPEVPAYPAPLPEPRPTPAAEEHPSPAKEEREEVKEKEEEVAEARQEVTTSSKPEPSLAPVTTPSSSSTNGISATQPPPAKEEEPAALSINMPTPQAAEPPLESPIAQPEELRLPNGLPLPSPQDPEKMSAESSECDVSPIAEPEVAQLQSEAPMPKPTPAPVVQATPAPVVQATPAPVVQATPAPVAQATPALAETATTTVVTAPRVEDEMDSPPPQSTTPAGESSMQGQYHLDCVGGVLLVAAVSVPKKKRKMKDLNKKEAVGDLLDAFKEPEQATPTSASDAKEPRPAATPAVEEVDETWEEKEDKLDAENIEPKPEDLKYQYKEDPEEKKRYDRDFLLGFQFISAAMSKPEGLPQISDVVLDKANKAPLRQLDPSRLPGMNMGPDFTPSFANLGRPGMGGGGGGGGGHRGGPPSGMGGGGPRRSQQGQRKEPRRIINISSSLTEDVKLNKAEKAWKPAVKKAASGQAAPEEESDDSEQAKTQELFKRVRSILNKLTPQMFQQLMKQVTELTIDTEERLKGVIDLIFEKAISEPNFSVAYANMCRCLIGLKVPTTDKPGVTVNFRKLLLNRCQKEFEKDKDDDVIFEKKQKELDAAATEEKDRLKAELEEAKDKARRRSLGNIKFIGELFKLKMLTEAIMHDCIVKLLKNHDEESLECLCRLLSTIGKDLDFEKAKPRMDQYFAQMDKIIKEKKTSSRIRFMLQDVLDLRRNTWVPRRGEQGPKTIDQIHKDAELEEHREVLKVQQDQGSRGGQHPQTGQRSQPQDEGWNTVPISTKSRPIDTSRLSKITKVSDTLYCGFSATNSSSRDRGSDRFERHDRGSNDRFDRRDDRRDDRDRNRPPVTKRSFSRETEEHSREREHRGPADPVRRVASMTDDRGSRDRGSRDRVKREAALTPPPAQNKPALSEEMLGKKSTAIIEEYLHINDMKEALQCVVEMNSTPLLFVFVRSGLESTLERSPIARERMGLLLHQLYKAGTLPKEQYYRGLQEILEVAEDMAIDVPHIWLYLAELITPMLHEGGIPMGQLFKEISKPLVPQGTAGVLLVQILTLLCKGMSHKKAGAMWREAGLSWKDFLPEDEDVNKFVTEKNVEFTLGGGEDDETEKSSKKELSSEELTKQLDRLIQDKADNQRIYDWVEANLDETQMSSNMFVRAVMTSICQSAIICESPYKLDAKVITRSAKLLHKYLKDEQKELQALYALQALMVEMEQPANLLRMFFDTLYDEDVIKEEAFYKWESSKDPAEMQGKGVALKSVTAFFTWLREAEDEESDNNS
uniref:Eukaryotic translation initiation factor 4 gamma 1 n=1 Tax=Salmo trutta TaxID=8032 RepID=A0A673YSF7_SALTR